MGAGASWGRLTPPTPPAACVLSQSQEAAAEPEACEVVQQRTDPRTCWLPLQVPVGALTSEEFKAFLSPFL